ncbi:hypothetical protein D6D15_06039 [Aureobasidium pullulans]|uniref:Uncharacterized protein n=1 Tax=Aureobasidium pullulans TaxID=5580 RepID=A0A4S9B674_AURPU|nr:hypothetical protein D6D15_06039 [Aureobasidium pullulans]
MNFRRLSPILMAFNLYTMTIANTILDSASTSTTMSTLLSISPTASSTIIAMSATPTPLETTPSSGARGSHSTAAIIGGAIGGTVALLFLLGCIFIPLIRRRRSCLDIALRRHSANTTTTTTTTSSTTHHNSSASEKNDQQGDQERGLAMTEEQKLEEMVGLEEMLRIKFPTPSRYELDAGSFVEGRANWEIKL